MNGGLKSNRDKKGGMKTLPSIDKVSSSNILPPPPLPNLNFSPRDDTKIMLNGQVVDMDEVIEKRIQNNENVINPITPPPVDSYIRNLVIPHPMPLESNLSPNKYIPENIKIVESPPKKIPTPAIEQIMKTRESTPKVETVSSISTPRSERSAFTVKTTITSMTKTMKTGTNVSNKSKSIFSMIPKIKTNKERFIQPIPREDTPIRESQESTPERVKSPVNIPMPVYNINASVISPIKTIGAKSPAIIAVKPDEEPLQMNATSPVSQAFTPRSIPKTPPPLFRSPRVKSPGPAIRSVPMTPQPSTSQFYLAPQQRNNLTYRANYSNLTPEQITYLKSEFRVKFGILLANYPQWNVIEPHESLDLDQIHDLYDHYIRQIMVSKETGQYKAYMVIVLMFIEVIGVKLLKLNMSGYTMSQLRIINRYDALFTELGEKWLSGGPSNFPVEARILMMMGFNAVIFLVVRYLCSWMGIEGLADSLQNAIDSLLNGPNMLTQNPVPKENGTIPDPINLNPSASAEQSAQSSNPLDGIMNTFGSIFGGGNGGQGINISEAIASLGTKFTSAMQNSNQKNQAINTVKQQEAAKKKLNKKKLFSD